MGMILDKNVSYGHYYEHWKNPESTPDYTIPQGKHDPQLGFDRPRKPRISPMTVEELDSCRLDFYERDYCALQLAKIKKCMRDNQPFGWRCTMYKHDYLQCEAEDHITRSKEYERERRLNLRDQAIAKLEAKRRAEEAAAAQAESNDNKTAVQ